MKAKSFLTWFFGIIAVTLSLCYVFAGINIVFVQKGRAEAADIYSLLNDGMIRVYESEIAKGKVLSQFSKKQLDMLSKDAGVSVGKYKAALLVCDLAERTGLEISLSSLLKKDDMKFLSTAKKVAVRYASSLSDERKEELKKLFLKEAGEAGALLSRFSP